MKYFRNPNSVKKALTKSGYPKATEGGDGDLSFIRWKVVASQKNSVKNSLF